MFDKMLNLAFIFILMLLWNYVVTTIHLQRNKCAKRLMARFHDTFKEWRYYEARHYGTNHRGKRLVTAKKIYDFYLHIYMCIDVLHVYYTK